MANAVQGPYPSKVFWSLSSFHACSNVFGDVGLSWWAVSNARMECLVTKKRPIAMGHGLSVSVGSYIHSSSPGSCLTLGPAFCEVISETNRQKKHEKSLPQCWKSKRMAFCKPSFFGSKQSIFGWCFRCFQRNDLRYNVDIFFCRSSLKNILCICVHICIYISYIHAPCQSGDVSGRRPELLQFPLPTQLQDRRNLEPQSHAAKVASCSWRVRHPGGDSKLPQTCSWTTKKKL